jgi:hypothetical protein
MASGGPIPRCKPFKHTYEKEIVIDPSPISPHFFQPRLPGFHSHLAHRWNNKWEQCGGETEIKRFWYNLGSEDGGTKTHPRLAKAPHQPSRRRSCFQTWWRFVVHCHFFWTKLLWDSVWTDATPVLQLCSSSKTSQNRFLTLTLTPYNLNKYKLPTTGDNSDGGWCRESEEDNACGSIRCQKGDES